MTPAEKIGPILELLDRHYPEAHVTLDFANPLELLVATVLSAQCTDVRVNQVTPALFEKHPTAGDYAAAPLVELEEYIRPTGFLHQKAKSLQGICRALVASFEGQVPASLEELVKLPGIGRKTANVILGNAILTGGCRMRAEVFVFLFILGVLFFSWPIMSIFRDSLAVFLFIVWLVFIALIFLTGIFSKREDGS